MKQWLAWLTFSLALLCSPLALAQSYGGGQGGTPGPAANASGLAGCVYIAAGVAPVDPRTQVGLQCDSQGRLITAPNSSASPTNVAIADGADVTLGAKGDAANCATAQTLIACIRQLHADLIAALPAGTNLIGYTNADPCSQGVKSQMDFESGTSGGSIITAVSAKKAYICSVAIVTSAAAHVSLIEGTGSSVCTGGTPSGDYLNTGVTAGNGASFAANGGVRDGGANATIAQNATANQNTCVLFDTTNTPQVNVHVSYVQAP